MSSYSTTSRTAGTQETLKQLPSKSVAAEQNGQDGHVEEGVGVHVEKARLGSLVQHCKPTAPLCRWVVAHRDSGS